jgi:hypothetical protein
VAWREDCGSALAYGSPSSRTDGSWIPTILELWSRSLFVDAMTRPALLFLNPRSEHSLQIMEMTRRH